MSLYLTAILPPKQLSEEIDDIRKEISEQHQVFAALKPPVHITLYRPIRMTTDMEPYLVRWLKPISSVHQPFNQQIENFDSFNNKTLFVNCVKNPNLQALQKDVASVYIKNKIDTQEVKGSLRFHPHITIAYRDIKPETFAVLWDEFKNRKFKRSYVTDRFSLLKHDGQRWNVLEEFELRKTEELTLF